MANKSEVETKIVDTAIETTADQIEETAASDSLKPNSRPEGAANKAGGLAKVVDAFAKFGPETINKFLASLEQIGKEADSISSGAAAKNKASINAKEEIELDDSIKAIIKEDIDALFEGEDLKEEFKEKVSVLFESAINLKSAKRTLELEEQYAALHEQEMETMAANLAETVNTYLDYSVKQWMDANEVAIESTLRRELVEDFMHGLHTLFNSHYITVPDQADDLVEDLQTRIEELEAKLSTQIDEVVALKTTHSEEVASLTKKIEEAAISAAFEDASKDLAESDVEKLKALSESVEYTSVEEYSSKVAILKESHFSKKTIDKQSVLFEETEVIEEAAVEPKLGGNMSRYVSAISHTVRS